MAREVEFTIVDGPSKFDLMISLFEGHSWERKAVEMKLELRGDLLKFRLTMKMQINQIEREDGSGERWNFIASPLSGEPHPVGITPGERGWSRITGYYSTQDRKGILKYFLTQPEGIPATT